jgi:hypothetical protein
MIGCFLGWLTGRRSAALPAGIQKRKTRGSVSIEDVSDLM